MKAKKQTELQLLENCRLILNNFKEVPIIREKMSDLGYNDARMQHGAKLYENAMRLYEINKNETARHRVAYDKLAADFASLKKSYSRDRKIAKVALRNYPELWHYLSINGSSSRSNLKLISDMETFYTNAIDIPEIKSLLAKYKIDDTTCQLRLNDIQLIKANRDIYNKDKGQSQDATKNKNKAFHQMQFWINEFYANAKIALEDNPQLIETIGKSIRS